MLICLQWNRSIIIVPILSSRLSIMVIIIVLLQNDQHRCCKNSSLVLRHADHPYMHQKLQHSKRGCQIIILTLYTCGNRIYTESKINNNKNHCQWKSVWRDAHKQVFFILSGPLLFLNKIMARSSKFQLCGKCLHSIQKYIAALQSFWAL